MSIDQNEPQVGQTNSGPQGPPSTQDAQSGQGQQRRRRRRRKAGKVAVAVSAEASQSLSGEQTSFFASAEPAEVRDVSRDPVSDPSREQARDQNRSQPREVRRDGAQGQNGGDGGQRQARPQGQQQHSQGKKNHQRQNKGGGPNQGRQFSKAAGGGGGQAQQNPGNGMGNGQPGQGGRRKNKVRRQAPSFVGPMDHSYRTVNGNIADGPPSTMDFRSHGMVNGNGNGNGGYGYGSGGGSNANGNILGRNGYSDAPDYLPPAAIREDAPVRIFCFIEDLFIVAKMQETARKLGVKVAFAKAEKDTIARLTESSEAERPSLIVFDLNNVSAKPLTLIPKLKAKLKRGTSVIGFLSHVQGDLKVKAIEAGCDMVMPKSAFSQNLPNLLRRHGLDEELETLEV
jgi:hypothetical protein